MPPGTRRHRHPHRLRRGPPRVEYELTELGEGLRAPVRAFTQWLTDHHGEIEAARARHDNA
ncbi:winged helix-turn-helix transcriptional regulator [Streptomyces sp. NPDC056390]|uniref:winged helix-turn-helix transcriptional regulator n=1 Tax=Streptomyces sp. NPDC056390 TaxID=3345806 RepID=UPI0035DF3EAC